PHAIASRRAAAPRSQRSAGHASRAGRRIVLESLPARFPDGQARFVPDARTDVVRAPASVRAACSSGRALVVMDAMENRKRRTSTVVDMMTTLAIAAVLAACQGDLPARAEPTAAPPATDAKPAAPAQPAAAPARAARQEPLEGGPAPTLIVSQAQFVD